MVRKTARIIPTNTLWIFCEGKTENNYFSKYRTDCRIQRLKIKVHISSDRNPTSMVNYCKEYIQHNKDSFQDNDEILCVFDRDENTDDEIQNSVNIAKESRIHMIFSNPNFEYWLLCHFEKYTQPCEKDFLQRKLDSHIGTYNKNDPDIYSKLKDNIEFAIITAKDIMKMHENNSTMTPYTERNPSTEVFKVFEMIEGFKHKI